MRTFTVVVKRSEQRVFECFVTAENAGEAQRVVEAEIERDPLVLDTNDTEFNVHEAEHYHDLEDEIIDVYGEDDDGQ